MDYQSVITSYLNKKLDISKLKKEFEIASPLKGRPKYRAIQMSEFWGKFNRETTEILMMNENADKLEDFQTRINSLIDSYYLYLLDCIKGYKAWNVIELESVDYSYEIFEQYDIREKIKKVQYLNNKYKEFLKYQKLADVRDVFNIRDLNDENILKIAFTMKMFDSFKNNQIKKEFFCFDKDFLIALIAFNKSKKIRLDDYMRSKNKTIQDDYEKYLVFYKLEDFREIIEKVVVINQNVKISVSRVIDIFMQISETDAEIDYIISNGKELKNIEEKQYRFLRIDYIHTTEILKESKQTIKQTMKKSNIFEQVFFNYPENTSNQNSDSKENKLLLNLRSGSKKPETDESVDNEEIFEKEEKLEVEEPKEDIVEQTEKEKLEIKKQEDIIKEIEALESNLESKVEEKINQNNNAKFEEIKKLDNNNENEIDTEEDSNSATIDVDEEDSTEEFDNLEVNESAEKSKEKELDSGSQKKVEIKNYIEQEYSMGTNYNVKNEITSKQEKEQVIPLIFSWFERDDMTFTRRVTIKKLAMFFDKIKKNEKENSVKVSLFLITNASKDVTKKRIIEMRKKAINNDLPDFIEGAMGGYSSFKVDNDGNIEDFSIMSNINREKIIKLLDNTSCEEFWKDKIVEECTDYVRYQFCGRKDKYFRVQSLREKIDDILSDERVKGQPIRFVPYSDGSGIGVDVVLKSQLNNISKVSKYYRDKYEILSEKAIRLNMEKFETFIEE